jgi:NAD(P)-dependent dehydrogenase (short-subunit alcohol dehydrogenase family)
MEIERDMTGWSGKKVLIIGIARQGTALARYLAGKGARVVLNDRRPAEALRAEALFQDLDVAGADLAVGDGIAKTHDGAGRDRSGGGGSGGHWNRLYPLRIQKNSDCCTSLIM